MPMAIVGYEEEMRMLAMPTLLPGSESGAFGQDDVASPVFLAWQKHDRSSVLLEQCLATLAPIAKRALKITSRPVPEKLRKLTAERAMGYDAAQLAQVFRQKIFGS